MTWQDYLNKQEAAELDRLRKARDDTAGEYNSLWRKLKARCDSRVRQAKKKEAEE